MYILSGIYQYLSTIRQQYLNMDINKKDHVLHEYFYQKLMYIFKY